VPDFLACLGGLMIGIETKAGRNTPTELQRQQLRQIMAAGGLALVVNEQNLDTLSRLLQDIRHYGSKRVFLYPDQYRSLFSWAD
jgi:L-2-hydroxyglutarate oxidase LhgO